MESGPSEAASIKGVLPDRVALLTSPPAASACVTFETSPVLTASHTGASARVRFRTLAAVVVLASLLQRFLLRERARSHTCGEGETRRRL